MAVVESRHRSIPEPPQVADAFVLELRTNAARVPAIPVRPLTAAEVAVAVRYAQDEVGRTCRSTCPR